MYAVVFLLLVTLSGLAEAHPHPSWLEETSYKALAHRARAIHFDYRTPLLAHHHPTFFWREQLHIYPSKPSFAPVRVGEFLVSAYTSRREETDDSPFITASGERVRWGVVASNVFPFGTQLQFPELYGDKKFVVEDRTHPRFRNRIDIWMSKLEHARKFGLRKTFIVVLAPPRNGAS